MVYPFILYSQLDQFLRYVSLDPMGAELSRLQTVRTEMTWLIVLLQVVFMSTVFLISIFTSHRIAGPLYKLNQFFIRMRTGGLGGQIVFRKADHFGELADNYNAMINSIDKRILQAIDSLEANKSDQALGILRDLRKNQPG